MVPVNTICFVKVPENLQKVDFRQFSCELIVKQYSTIINNNCNLIINST